MHFFSNFGSGWPPHPVNWSPSHSTGPQAIQLVPKPFNWSPNTAFNRYLSDGRSNHKISKNKVHFLSFFKEWVWPVQAQRCNTRAHHGTMEGTFFAPRPLHSVMVRARVAALRLHRPNPTLMGFAGRVPYPVGDMTDLQPVCY